MASYGHNELHQAIYSRNWSKVKQLMREKPQLVNEIDKDGKTPLHYAADDWYVNAPEEVCVLLVEGATTETLDLMYSQWLVYHRSLLHRFSRLGFAACVTRVLAKSRTRLNTQDDKYGQTPLHHCAKTTGLTFQQHLSIISTMLSNRADIAIKDKDGKTAAELYEINKCGEYDKNKKEEERSQIGYLLRGEVPHQIVLKGYDAVLIYVKALEKGSEQSEKCNLMVVGQARVGKTSLIKRFTGQRFNAHEEETDGIVITMTCEIGEHDEEWNLEPIKSVGKRKTSKSLSLKIYDFAGQEIYYTTHQVFIMPRAVFMLVFDLALDLNAKALIEIERDHRLQNIPKWMVKVATFLGWKRNVKVYELDMTNLDFITYWLSSIYVHTEENKQEDGSQAKQLSPPVFIVGTHENSLPGNKSQRDAKVKEIFENVYESLKGKPFLEHVVTKYYAVDSSLNNDVEIRELQRHVLEVIKGEPYMNERIPFTWLILEATLEEKRKEMNLIGMTKARDIAAECGVDNSEFSIFLQFQHDTGNCVYFENKANVNDPLNHNIILNQMWLNGMFKCVITAKQPEFAQFSESWNRLKNQGLLDEKLARHVWRKDKTDPDLLFSMMSRFDLLCEMQFSTKESDRRRAEGTRVFCLPCCLKETIEHPIVVKDDNSNVRFFVDFDGFLPGGLFFRLMVRVIRFSQERGGRDHRLSRHNAEFHVDQDHHLCLRIFFKDRSLMEVIIVRVAGNGPNPSPAVCQMVLKFLMDALSDLCNIWSKGVKFTFGIPCDQCQDDTDKLHLHTFDECTQALRVSCKRRRMNTDRFQHLFVTGLDHVYIQETKNFQMILSLVTDLGTEQMRKFFLSRTKIDKADVGQFLMQEQQTGRFKGVRVFEDQKKKMFRPDADISNFDITLMMMLIRHCCGVSRPDDFWKNPDELDKTDLANMVRIREYRNKLAHTHNNRIPTNEFEDEWKKLTAIFQGFGVAADGIDKFRQIAL